MSTEKLTIPVRPVLASAANTVALAAAGAATLGIGWVAAGAAVAAGGVALKGGAKKARSARKAAVARKAAARATGAGRSASKGSGKAGTAKGRAAVSRSGASPSKGSRGSLGSRSASAVKRALGGGAGAKRVGGKSASGARGSAAKGATGKGSLYRSRSAAGSLASRAGKKISSPLRAAGKKVSEKAGTTRAAAVSAARVRAAKWWTGARKGFRKMVGLAPKPAAGRKGSTSIQERDIKSKRSGGDSLDAIDSPMRFGGSIAEAERRNGGRYIESVSIGGIMYEECRKVEEWAAELNHRGFLALLDDLTHEMARGVPMFTRALVELERKSTAQWPVPDEVRTKFRLMVECATQMEALARTIPDDIEDLMADELRKLRNPEVGQEMLDLGANGR